MCAFDVTHFLFMSLVAVGGGTECSGMEQGKESSEKKKNVLVTTIDGGRKRGEEGEEEEENFFKHKIEMKTTIV